MFAEELLQEHTVAKTFCDIALKPYSIFCYIFLNIWKYLPHSSSLLESGYFRRYKPSSHANHTVLGFKVAISQWNQGYHSIHVVGAWRFSAVRTSSSSKCTFCQVNGPSVVEYQKHIFQAKHEMRFRIHNDDSCWRMIFRMLIFQLRTRVFCESYYLCQRAEREKLMEIYENVSGKKGIKSSCKTRFPTNWSRYSC